MIAFATLLALLSQSTPAPAQPAAAAPKYQMTTYYMVFLRAVVGQPDLADAEATTMPSPHLAHLAALNREGVNLLYGPFLDEGDLRGLAVMKVASADEARARFDEDPYVKSGRLAVEVKPWMGPVGWFHPPDDPPTPEHLFFGFLMSGPNRSQGAEDAAALQKAHLAYMDGLHQQGKLIMAGPFLDDSKWRGVVVYRVGSLDEAKALAGGDPMVRAGRLAIDARPWMTFKGILK